MDLGVYLELAENLPALDQIRARFEARRATALARGDRGLAEDLAPIARAIESAAARLRTTLAQRDPDRAA